jgi:PAS domain S-box-containing protein
MNNKDELMQELDRHRKRIEDLTRSKDRYYQEMEACKDSEKACRESETALKRECDSLELRLNERAMELKSAIKSLQSEIRERKRLESAVAWSEGRYHDLVQSANSIILRMDAEGKIIFINEFACRFFGFDEEEIVGKNVIGTIVPLTETSGRDLAAMIHDLGIHTERYVANENENMRKDGERVWVAWTNKAIMDKDGKVAEILCIGNEITGLKHAEESLLKTRDDLEKRVKERTAELSNINQALQAEIAERVRAEKELREAKSQSELYVDLMAHDINNLNQVAMGYLELAKDTLSLDKDHTVLLDKPLEMLDNSSKLIDNVRKIQRARGGERPSEKIDIGELLDILKKEYSTTPGRDILINYTPVPGQFVVADELLRDVFENIIGNTIKHSTGPLIVDIDVNKVEARGQEYYSVAIEDNGPGIDDELKNELFKIDKKGTAKKMGHGIGLFLVQMLVKNYHGTVSVEDRVPGDHKKGVRFIVMLPVAPIEKF